MRHSSLAVPAGIRALAGFLIGSLVVAANTSKAEDIVAVQECLTFTQFYLGLADGTSGPMTDSAVRAFQRSLNESQTGSLTPSQSSRLFTLCSDKKRALGWAPFRFRLGTVVDLPLGVLKQTEESVGQDVAIFEGFNGDLGLVVFANDRVSPAALDDVYGKVADLTIEQSYRVRKDNWFVVSGVTREGAFVYSYARRDGSRLFGYTMVWSRRVGELVGGVQIMILNSFKSRNFGAGGTAAAETGVPSSPRPGPGAGQPVVVALSPAEIFRRTKDSIWVLVSAGWKGNEPDWDDVAQGSAVAVGPDRLLTNCHTLAHHTVHVIAQKNFAVPVMVQVAKADYEHDKCVLRSERTLPSFVEVRRYDTIDIGEEAYSIGAPKGLELTIANGIVSGKRLHEGIRYLQTTAPISPGSSGGGLFDTQARLIGVTTMYLDEAQNLNFAIAADEF